MSFLYVYQLTSYIGASFVSSLSTAIIMRVSYGHRVVSDDDEFLRLANDHDDAINNCGPPGSTPVDFFPFCKQLSFYHQCSGCLKNWSIVREQVQHMPRWFPGAFYAGYARDWRPAVEKMHNVPFELVQKQMVRCLTFSITHRDGSKSREGRWNRRAILSNLPP